jgi:hypothetical protein
MLWIITIFLIILCCFLCFIIYYIAKKATYLSKKEKEFLEFAISMYIDYSKQLDIISEQHHDIIIQELKKIKERYF